jgi:curved DNA-binding protein CbpA
LNRVFSADAASRKPRPVPGCDIRSLPIGPEEAFLLSRIDGSVSEAELTLVTGLPPDTVKAAVARLAALGAIAFEGEPTAPTPTSGAPAATSLPAAKPSEEPKPADGIDLGSAQRKKILDLFLQLDDLDHYALLGVPREADKKDIRKAYYAAAPDFHPDRFFGKNLGSWKPRMEAIFGKITLAYETLGSKERRAEYDAYLASQQQTRTIEELLHGPPPEPIPSPVPGAPTPPFSPTPFPPLTEAAPTAVVAARVTPERPPAITSSIPPRSAEEERARREALARKLAGSRGSLPPDPHRTSVPPTSSRAASEAAAQDLRRRRDAILSEGRRSQVARYVDAAKAGLAHNNVAAAANAYRLALALDPENPEIALAHQETAKIATAALAEGYLKQADYEARAGNWSAAAKSYVRAALGSPEDATVLHQAAVALLKAAGDLHQAVDFAKRAVALQPRRIEPRLTLVEIYMAAGMPLMAKRELEAARELAPQDARMTELGKRLK